jgi:hypothetical protein
VTVTHLVTFADVDDRQPGYAVSARHAAVLSDGREILLLDDRGWSSSRRDDSETIEDLERTARMVVGPDEPRGGRTRAEMEAGHWATLAKTLEQAGIHTDADTLKALPHEVVLGDRLRRRVSG